MQSAAKPFVKEKWDEVAYFLVQVSVGTQAIRIEEAAHRQAGMRMTAATKRSGGGESACEGMR